MAFVLQSVTGGVARVTLNRPEVRNAFNEDVIAALTQAFVSLGQRDDVRCIVLAGEGAAFCAGADLNWMRRMADYSRDENIADAGQLANMLRAVYECPRPTVASIQGDVYAGGMGLVAACDIAVSSDAANYCLSEVKLGLLPATISPYVMRAMGPRAAHRYFLTAERFSAAEALRIGFVHEVVPAAELQSRVDAIAAALLTASPQAIGDCKQLLHDVGGQPFGDDLRGLTIEAIADSRASTQGKDGVQAFLQKRKPSWIASRE